MVIFGVANITPAQAARIAATIQIARLLGNEVGNALIQTFVRVREQIYSNLIGLHFVSGALAPIVAATQLSRPVCGAPDRARRPEPARPRRRRRLLQREAYVLAYIDGFWLIAWVLTAGILLMLLLRPPPPNPLTPPRSDL